jgi:hypothetical protein
MAAFSWCNVYNNSYRNCLYAVKSVGIKVNNNCVIPVQVWAYRFVKLKTILEGQGKDNYLFYNK